MSEEQNRLVKVIAHQVLEHYEPQERDAIGEWLRRLLEVRSSNLPVRTKARLALQATDRSVILPLARHIGEQGKRVVWTDRSWAARLGLGAAGAAAVTVGSQGAGIAALGSAIGVPLWIVFGAGGSFAGMLLDELGIARGSSPAVPTGDTLSALAEADVVEADWVFFEDLLPTAVTLREEDNASTSDEPLWSVFKNAYKTSRMRQRKKSGSEDPA